MASYCIGLIFALICMLFDELLGSSREVVNVWRGLALICCVFIVLGYIDLTIFQRRDVTIELSARAVSMDRLVVEAA